MANTLQVKRGAKASLPTLDAGEFGFSTDTYEIFIGDGVANHQLLLYDNFDANTILASNVDNTPLALEIAEQTLVGRITSGNITDLTATEIRTLINVEDNANNGLSDVVDDTSPQLGGDLEYNEQYQVFDTTLTSDDTAAGDIITVTFGESVVFGEVCYPNATENEWMKALGTNVAVKYPGMGIALETKANGESGKFLLRGTIRDDSAFAGAMGDLVYLSDVAGGDVLYTAPNDSGDIVQILGFVIAENYIYFNPDYTYVEIS